MRLSQSAIKIGIHGLFSPVVKKTGYNSADVNFVYSWYLNNTLKEINTRPACQIYLRGLGMLKFDAFLGIKNLAGQIYGLSQSLTKFINGDKAIRIKYSYLIKKHDDLADAIVHYEQRLIKLQKIGFYKETYCLNKLAALEKLKNNLNQLYESIQRIPEDQQKRTSERGQDLVWSDEQGSRPF